MTFAYASAQESNDTILNVKQKVLSINQESDYWISTFDNEAFLDSAFIHQAGKGYGKLTGYFKNGKVCKIRELIGIKLMHDFAVTEYYFSNGKLIYVNEMEKQGPDIFIDSDGTVDQRIDEPTFEAEYYYYNDTLISTAEKGDRKTMLLPDPNFFDSMSKEGQLLLSARKYYQLFSRKYKE